MIGEFFSQHKSKIIEFILLRLSRLLKNVKLKPDTKKLENIEINEQLINWEYLGGRENGFEIQYGRIKGMELSIPKDKILESAWKLTMDSVEVRIKVPTQGNLLERIREIIGFNLYRGIGSRNSMVLTRSLLMGGIQRKEVEKTFSEGPSACLAKVIETIVSNICCSVNSFTIIFEFSKTQTLKIHFNDLQMRDTSMKSTNQDSFQSPIVKYSMSFNGLNIRSNQHSILTVPGPTNEVNLTISPSNVERHTYIDIVLNNPSVYASPHSLKILKKIGLLLKTNHSKTESQHNFSDSDDSDGSFHSIRSPHQSPFSSPGNSPHSSPLKSPQNSPKNMVRSFAPDTSRIPVSHTSISTTTSERLSKVDSSLSSRQTGFSSIQFTESQYDNQGNIDLSNEVSSCIHYNIRINGLTLIVLYTTPSAEDEKAKFQNVSQLRMSASQVIATSLDNVDNLNVSCSFHQIQWEERVWNKSQMQKRQVMKPEDVLKFELLFKKKTNSTEWKFIIKKLNLDLDIGMLRKLKPFFLLFSTKKSDQMMESMTQSMVEMENQLLDQVGSVLSNRNDKVIFQCEDFFLNLSFPIENDPTQFYPNQLAFELKTLECEFHQSLASQGKLNCKEFKAFIDSDPVIHAIPSEITLTFNEEDIEESIWSVHLDNSQSGLDIDQIDLSQNSFFSDQDMLSPSRRKRDDKTLPSTSTNTSDIPDLAIQRIFEQSKTKLDIDLSELMVTLSKQQLAIANQLIQKLVLELSNLKTSVSPPINSNDSFREVPPLFGVNLSANHSKMKMRTLNTKTYQSNNYQGVFLFGKKQLQYYIMSDFLELEGQEETIWKTEDTIVKPYHSYQKRLSVNICQQANTPTTIDVNLFGLYWKLTNHRWWRDIFDFVDGFSGKTSNGPPTQLHVTILDTLLDYSSDVYKRQKTHSTEMARSLLLVDKTELIGQVNQFEMKFSGVTWYSHATYQQPIFSAVRNLKKQIETNLFGLHSMLKMLEFQEVLTLDHMTLEMIGWKQISLTDGTLCLMMSKDSTHTVWDLIYSVFIGDSPRNTQEESFKMINPIQPSHFVVPQSIPSDIPSPSTLINPTILDTPELPKPDITFIESQGITIVKTPSFASYTLDDSYFNKLDSEVIPETEEIHVEKELEIKFDKLNVYCTLYSGLDRNNQRDSNNSIEVFAHNLTGSMEKRQVNGAAEWELKATIDDFKMFDHIHLSNRNVMIYGNRKEEWDRNRKFGELRLVIGTKWILELFVQPLRFNFHQYQKEFFEEFFSHPSKKKETNSNPDTPTGEEDKPQEPHFKSVRIHPISILLDYEAKSVKLSKFKTDSWKKEVVNMANVSDLKLELSEIHFLHNCHGWGEVLSKTVEAYLRDMSGQALVFALGFLPIRSAYKVGSGFYDIFYIPVTDEDSSWVSHVMRGTANFARTIAEESASLTANLSEGAANMLDFSDDSNKKNLPLNPTEGVQHAYQHFKSGFQKSAVAVVGIPRSTNSSTLMKQATLAVLAPVSGAASAFAQLAHGVKTAVGSERPDQELYKT